MGDLLPDFGLIAQRQRNVLLHTQYHRIPDIARQYRKPVRCFTQAGAFKGAVQVMENDLVRD